MFQIGGLSLIAKVIVDYE